MTATPTRGFTLIEVLIALAIAAILLVLAFPGYTVWLADSQIKNGAQSLASGLRYAQAEAIKRNAAIELVVDRTTKTGGWIAQPPGGPTLQSAVWEEGADRIVFTPAPAAGLTTVTFTGLGQIAPNADATATLEGVDLTSTLAGTRPLRVLVGGTRTGIKICDPAFAPPDPKACPPAGG